MAWSRRGGEASQRRMRPAVLLERPRWWDSMSVGAERVRATDEDGVSAVSGTGGQSVDRESLGGAIRMPRRQCPICSAVLEVRDVAPCFMCGGVPEELEHLREGQHIYSLYRFPTGTEMVLCNSCFLDMNSIGGEHWGLSGRHRITTDDLALVRDVIDPKVCQDGYCSNCCARASYLTALWEIIEANRPQPKSGSPHGGQESGKMAD